MGVHLQIYTSISIFFPQVVRTVDTSDETFDSLFAFGKRMKKEPVACKVSYKSTYFTSGYYWMVFLKPCLLI